MQKLVQNPPIFILNVSGTSVDAILDQVFEVLKEHERVPNEAIAEFEAQLHKHADLNHIEHGLAIIHHQTQKILDLEIVIRLQSPITTLYGKDGNPLHYIWILLGNTVTHHHAATAKEFSQLLKETELAEAFSQVQSGEEFLDVYQKGVLDEINFAHHIPAELRPTGKFAGGLVADIHRTLSTYTQDFVDGINSKSLASVFFLFFACLTPAIAFGGLLEVQTGGAVGVTEMIFATCLCGIIYSLFSGQPLTILGSTGPVIVFMGLLYPLCIEYSIPYLPTLACVGLWTTLFLVILTLIDACSWIRFFTRFTDDTLAALISLIFIYEAVKKMVGGFSPDDGGLTHYDKAFFSLMLGLGTFYVASALTSLRGGVYLRRRIREFLADFGTTIAIGSMILLSLFFSEINISRLDVPDRFEPTLYELQESQIEALPISVELKKNISINPSLLNAKDVLLEDLSLNPEHKKELTNLKIEKKEMLTAEHTKRNWFVNPLDAPHG